MVRDTTVWDFATSPSTLFVIAFLVGSSAGGLVAVHELNDAPDSRYTGPLITGDSLTPGERAALHVRTTAADGTTRSLNASGQRGMSGAALSQIELKRNGTTRTATHIYAARGSRLMYQQTTDDIAAHWAEAAERESVNGIAVNNSTNSIYRWDMQVASTAAPMDWLYSPVQVHRLLDTEGKNISWNGRDAVKYRAVSVADGVKSADGYAIVDAQNHTVYELDITASLNPDKFLGGDTSVELSYQRTTDENITVTEPSWTATVRGRVQSPSFRELETEARTDGRTIELMIGRHAFLPEKSNITVVTNESTHTVTTTRRIYERHPSTGPIRHSASGPIYLGRTSEGSLVLWKNDSNPPQAQGEFGDVRRVIISKRGVELSNVTVPSIGGQYNVTGWPADAVGRVYGVTISPVENGTTVPSTVTVTVENGSVSTTKRLTLDEGSQRFGVYHHRDEGVTVSQSIPPHVVANSGFQSRWNITVSVLGREIGQTRLPAEVTTPPNASMSVNASVWTVRNESSGRLDFRIDAHNTTLVDYIRIMEYDTDDDDWVTRRVKATNLRSAKLDSVAGGTRVRAVAVHNAEYGDDVTVVLYDDHLPEEPTTLDP